jgi:UDP-N-acetylglucosamine diphosphorylase/glucosamine-1-phosphate N-acetyltransferase
VSQIVLFEDAAVSRLLPLAWTRPVWDLRCGIWTLREAVERAYDQPVAALFVRDFLADVTRERARLPVNDPPDDGMCLLLNGRILADENLPDALPMGGEPRAFVTPDGTLLGAWVEVSRLQYGWEVLDVPAVEVNWPLLEWPWELFQRNGERIAAQAGAYALGSQPSLVGVHLLHPEHVFIGGSARVQPGVVLDASDGPIVIDEGATIMANSAILGPTYVGRGASVKIGAKLYHGITIGPHCKVGGELEEVVFQGHSNKQHDGFIGHAYIGEWCNFGADTNNSDLKNNYGTVSVWSGGALRDTGSMFVGLLMADHSKTGINSTLNTGTVVGVSCNLFGSGLPPKYVPSFAWGGAAGWSEYRLQEALGTAERVMGRRNVALTGAERALLSHVFEATADERGQHLGVGEGR